LAESWRALRETWKDKLKRVLKNAHSRPLANARGSESASLSARLVPSRDRQEAVLGFFQHPLKPAAAG
jgi:hypothetical protein